MNLLARPDLFRRNHKALRKALFDTAFQAGRTDFTQPGETACLMSQFGEMAYFFHVHLHMEDAFCLPVLEAKCPGSSVYYAAEHEHLDRMLSMLERQLSDVANSSDDQRNSLGYTFYLSLNRFVARCLNHMDDEETEMATLAAATCSDEELRDINRQIMGNTTPIEADILYRYMLPALSEPERAALLSEVKTAAPPSLRQQINSIARRSGSGKFGHEKTESTTNVLPFYMPVN